MKKFFLYLSFLLPLQIMAQQEYSADLCNDGVAFASTEKSGYNTAAKAFDNLYNVANNGWASCDMYNSSCNYPHWIGYDFRAGSEKKITQYSIRANKDQKTNAPSSWYFEASNDNLNWTILDTQTNQTNWNAALTPPEIRYYQVSNENYYRYYRIRITADNGGNRWVSIGEIEMMSNIEDVYTDYENKRGNIWYFGNNAGISFNTEPPMVLTDGQLVAREGCATICDTSGNLLFYTNGMTVWNKEHSIMENGDSIMLYKPTNPLHPTQSGVITPSPQDSVYYVFSSPCQWVSPANDRYFRYAIVDMRLNGGLGKVVQKDIQIGTANASERITAVAHANNEDIWVINHLDDSNTFQAFLITASGIDITNPVISNIGAVSSGNCNTGYLKASPDGKKLAMAFWRDASPSHFELYDFDAATGIISNLNNLGYPPSQGRSCAYGVEFSPDGSKLYGSTHMAKRIHQWDLNAGSAQQIRDSRVEIATTSNYVGALQLAPNGRIYCALSIDGNYGFERIGVIKYPNMKGTAAKYDDYGLYLEGKKSRQGFPNFVQSFLYRSAIKASSFCFGDSTQFSLSNTYMLSSVEWDFDDVASGHNTSTSFSPKHKFSSVGTYNVKLTRYYTNGTIDIVFHVVNINPMPVVDLGNDTILCSKPAVITLDAQNSGSSFLWNTGYTGQQLIVTDTGTYIVNVVNEYSCLGSDTIRVDFCPELLPITLYSFDAECKADNNVLIKWQTASEINNDYFLLERAFNRNDFDKIATISGSGNSNTLVEYEYTDIISAEQNEVLYRLKQFDFDGKSEYCGITLVNCGKEEYKLEIIYIEKEDYDNISIHFNSNKTGTHYYKIYNVDGRLMRNGKTYCDDYFNNKIKITLPSGIYILSIENDNSFVFDKISMQN